MGEKSECVSFHYPSFSCYSVCLKIIHLVCNLIYTFSSIFVGVKHHLICASFSQNPKTFPLGEGEIIFSSCTSVLLVISSSLLFFHISEFKSMGKTYPPPSFSLSLCCHWLPAAARQQFTAPGNTSP